MGDRWSASRYTTARRNNHHEGKTCAITYKEQHSPLPSLLAYPPPLIQLTSSSFDTPPLSPPCPSTPTLLNQPPLYLGHNKRPLIVISIALIKPWCIYAYCQPPEPHLVIIIGPLVHSSYTGEGDTARGLYNQNALTAIIHTSGYPPPLSPATALDCSAAPPPLLRHSFVSPKGAPNSDTNLINH